MSRNIHSRLITLFSVTLEKPIPRSLVSQAQIKQKHPKLYLNITIRSSFQMQLTRGKFHDKVCTLELIEKNFRPRIFFLPLV